MSFCKILRVENMMPTIDRVEEQIFDEKYSEALSGIQSLINHNDSPHVRYLAGLILALNSDIPAALLHADYNSINFHSMRISFDNEADNHEQCENFKALIDGVAHGLIEKYQKLNSQKIDYAEQSALVQM